MAYTLVITISLQLMLNLFIFVHYLSNFSYYSGTLCVNKNQQELKCNGMCQLATEIIITEGEPLSPENIPQFIVQSELLYLSILHDYTIQLAMPINLQDVYVNLYSYQTHTEIDHPPC